MLVTFKSHPYRDLEVIEWQERVLAARDFYGAPSCDKLKALQASYGITHAVLDVVGAYTIWDPNLDYCMIDDPFRDDEGDPLANGVNDFLDAHPLILTLLDSGGQTRMASALTHLQTAVALVQDGFDALAAEEDDQEDDLVPKDLLLFDEDDEPYWDLRDVERSLDPATLPAVVYRRITIFLSESLQMLRPDSLG